MKRRLWLAFLLVGVIAIASSGQTGREDKTDATIRKLDQDFAAAVSAGNLDRAMGHVSKDAHFLIAGKSMLEGRQAIREFAEGFFRAKPAVKLDILRVEHSGDLAFELARYTMTFPLADGTTTEEQGKLVNVWQRQSNGDWMLIVHAPSLDPRPGSEE